MRALPAILVAILAAFCFSGCETDVPPDPAPTANGPLGGGELVQPDNSGDPLIRENTRVGY